MAAVDPIAYIRFCKLFPSLTAKQATNCCFYSMGANYSEIASLQELSSTAVRRSLELSQKNLGASTLPGIKNIFWSGFIVRQIVNKYHLKNVKGSSSFSCLSSIFPELTLSEIICSVLLSGGQTKKHISGVMMISEDDISQHIDSAQSKLSVDSLHLLTLIVISRLMVDLG